MGVVRFFDDWQAKKFIILRSCDIILTKLLSDVFKLLSKLSEGTIIVSPCFIVFFRVKINCSIYRDINHTYGSYVVISKSYFFECCSIIMRLFSFLYFSFLNNFLASNGLPLPSKNLAISSPCDQLIFSNYISHFLYFRVYAVFEQIDVNSQQSATYRPADVSCSPI